MKCKTLRELAETTFGKRSGLVSLWQEFAENFYPERADFTVQRYMGAEFATNLSTSYPILCRRSLAGSFPTMLRPTNIDWFEMVLAHGGKADYEGKAWLQWASNTMRKAMYDLRSRFARAVVEGDNDYATFGQDVMSVRLNDDRDTLLYRCWHLRDVCWIEDDDGSVNTIFRKCKYQARYITSKWPDRAHNTVKKLAQKSPFELVDCMHMIVPMDTFEDDFIPPRKFDTKRFPYVSIYYDCLTSTVLEAVPTFNREYMIERWQTVSGSQYAYSPAAVAALPDARLLQAMTYTLLEAGEKATNPPMVATDQAVRSDVDIRAGGITWVDYDYDERLGNALRPLTVDKSGIPIGVDMQRDSRALLQQCFFLDKIKPFVPQQDPQMTAFQAGQIVAQYIRDAIPIFEPMESERNGQNCELTFEIMLRAGAFGPPDTMPKSLRGQDIDFAFQSPLHDAIEAQKGHKFLEMKQLIAEGVAMDQNASAVPNVIDALRDALSGIKVPNTWLHSEVTSKEMIAAKEDAKRQQMEMATLQQGAVAAKDTGAAMKSLADSQALAA